LSPGLHSQIVISKICRAATAVSAAKRNYTQNISKQIKSKQQKHLWI